MRRTTRKLHEWIGIGIGGLFVLWLVTGVVMMTPIGNRQAWFGPWEPLDYSTATVSPRQAIELATGTPPADEGGELAELPSIRDLTLTRMDGRAVYVVALDDGSARMVDAGGRGLVEVGEETARDLVLTEFDTDATIVDARLTDERDPWYLYGPLPVWRFEFDDARRTVSYVSVTDGSVRRSDRITRLKAVISASHTFDIFEAFHIGGAQFPAVVVTSIIGLLSVLTGYLLVWLSYRNKKAAKRRGS